MTKRLYYDEPNLTEFHARVLGCEQKDGAFCVLLDQTAFYPTGGGQPHDTGRIDGARVLDVYADEQGDIWHVCDIELPIGKVVSAQIDWDRRFDHMQQHAADHMIAGQLYQLTGAYTVGLHLGAQISTIDVVMPDGSTHLSDAWIEQIETLVNRDIQQDVPIRCFFPDEQEIAQLPLRKDPTVTEHIRVVMIGEKECVACGGTHPSTAGQLGLVKILSTAPARGKLRLTFVAGMRALKHYQVHHAAADRAAAMLSTQVDALPGAIEAQQQRMRELEHELSRLKRDQALAQMDQLIADAQPMANGWRLVTHMVHNMEMDVMRELAKQLIAQERVCVLLGNVQEQNVALLFARSAGDACDMGALLRETVQAFGGKGGGRPDFAQGAAPELEALSFAQKKLLHQT